MTCGQNMAPKSVSGVCSRLSPRPTPNSPNPRDVSSRASTRFFKGNGDRRRQQLRYSGDQRGHTYLQSIVVSDEG
jgi:hypothetical protein